MDIISAYREVGSYRGAAELCGTTHKTVRVSGSSPPMRPVRAGLTGRDAGSPPQARGRLLGPARPGR